VLLPRQRFKLVRGTKDKEHAIDSKLRGCDVVALKVEDVAPNGYSVDRATVRQKKTGRPVAYGGLRFAYALAFGSGQFFTPSKKASSTSPSQSRIGLLRTSSFDNDGGFAISDGG
jgi:hypothetical protein